MGSTDGFKGKPGDWSGIKALTGGTENIRDVLGNMVSNAAQLIDKSVKNEARLKIVALANETGGGKFMVKIDAETRPVKVDKQQALDGLLKAMGIDRHAPDLPNNVRKLIEDLDTDLTKSPGMMELFVGNQPPAGGNVLAVLKDGKPTWYEVGDPVLYRALSALDRPPKHWIVKWLGLPKRIGQTSITLTPDFMVANIARDTIMGSIMSRSGFRPVMDSLQGMRLRMTHDPLYKDYIANGGGLSSIYMDDSRFKAKLERFYSRQGIDYRTVLDAPDKLLNAVETIADAFEMSTRIGEYKRAIDKGEHPRHAAYQGREVSTDFAMRGDSKVLGFMYPMTNQTEDLVPRVENPEPGIRAGKDYGLATAEIPRSCDSCVNLTATQTCFVAAHGKLDFVSGSYRPYIHAPGRCIGYQPNIDVYDVRTGRELWPEIVAVILAETTGNTEGDTVAGGFEMTRDVRISDFLADILKDGPRGVAEIIAAAEGSGFPERTLQRAAERLGVVKSKAGFLGGWLWALPNTALTA